MTRRRHLELSQTPDEAEFPGAPGVNPLLEHDFQPWRPPGTPVALVRPGCDMRELETSLQQFGEFILKAQLVRENAAPYCVRFVRRFLTRPASDEPLADQVRHFCEDLERNQGCQDWQVRQAEHALRMYFVNFLRRIDWHRRPASTVVDEQGRTSPSSY